MSERKKIYVYYFMGKIVFLDETNSLVRMEIFLEFNEGEGRDKGKNRKIWTQQGKQLLIK